MVKIKTLYIAIALVSLIILGFLIIIPEFIPSAELVQYIAILVVYLLIITFGYALILRLRNYFFEKYRQSLAFAYTWLVSVGLVLCFLASFIFTSLGIGNGVFGGSFVKELDYPTHHVKLYIYDDSFIEQFTTIKLKDKTLPVMRNIGFIENHSPIEVQIARTHDTVVFSAKNIQLRFDLKSRKAEKVYLDNKKQW